MNEIEELLDIVACNFMMLKKQASVIRQIADTMIEALDNGNKIIFCGNGGSAADAQHLAADLMGRYKRERKSLPSISLTVDTSALTAIANDYGYEKVFSRQLEGIGRKGDVLVAISTSGHSVNVIDAVKVAQKMKIKTIAFTGNSGGKLSSLVDIALKVPSDITNNIQEMHTACGHIICGIVEAHIV